MRLIKRALGVILFIGGVISILGYFWVFRPNTAIEETQFIYIPSQSDYQDVKNILDEKSILKNMASFDVVARLMKYDLSKVKTGKYAIDPGMSNRELISRLRIGNQVPIQLTFQGARTIEDLVKSISEQLEVSEEELSTAFSNHVLMENYGFDSSTFISMFIPNTYQIYWNAKPEELTDRIFKEYSNFWSASRTGKAESLGLSPKEVSTLASIVEKESQNKAERPTIAGVYLNRLEQGILLQADPTVVYGVGDFTIRRVLNKHLRHDSPYNTYLHKGLPPGPICMPSINSIDAVLNAESHDYLFFCAKPGYAGEHLFARTNREHEQNARVYRRWLNKEGIRG